MLNIISAQNTDAKAIEALAAPIWKEHYTSIIGAEQVDYMLKKFQSESAILSQMSEDLSYFLVQENTKNIGYMAIKTFNNQVFISKFYLACSARGKGFAKSMLNFVKSFATQQKHTKISLTVNKFNPAYEAYLKLGFKNVESIQIDIGGGFIMDDYKMELELL